MTYNVFGGMLNPAQSNPSHNATTSLVIASFGNDTSAYEAIQC